MSIKHTLWAAGLFTVVAFSASAQGANIALGTTGFDVAQPVEVSADTLNVDQGTGEAIFDGNVLVVQGDVRLSADRLKVVYGTDSDGNASGIERLEASGGVTFVTAADAAEAQEAVYAVADGQVTLSGNVLLTQGASAISGERLVLDLETGTGQMEGRIRTIIGAGGDN